MQYNINEKRVKFPASLLVSNFSVFKNLIADVGKWIQWKTFKTGCFKGFEVSPDGLSPRDYFVRTTITNHFQIDSFLLILIFCLLFIQFNDFTTRSIFWWKDTYTIKISISHSCNRKYLPGFCRTAKLSFHINHWLIFKIVFWKFIWYDIVYRIIQI